MAKLNKVRHRARLGDVTQTLAGFKVTIACTCGEYTETFTHRSRARVTISAQGAHGRHASMAIHQRDAATDILAGIFR